MTLPTNAEIDAAVPPAGTPHRGLTNAVLKQLAAGPSASDIEGITAIGQDVLTAVSQADALGAIGAAAEDHTHATATQSANGFMSAADKTKLDGIEAGAQANAVWGDIDDRPAVVASGATQAEARASIGAGTSNLTIGTTADTAAPGNHRHTNATSTADGFMSKEDKIALTGILADPTETSRGAPMEASEADVTAATSGSKMMSPRRVLSMIRNAVSAATETLRGTIRVGTQAEVNAGTLDNVAVTPKKLRNGFSFSSGATGHIRLPSFLGGLQICWGGVSLDGSNQAQAVFSLAFSSANYAVVASADESSNNYAFAQAVSKTASGFAAVAYSAPPGEPPQQLQTAGFPLVRVNYVAIGV